MFVTEEFQSSICPQYLLAFFGGLLHVPKGAATQNCVSIFCRRNTSPSVDKSHEETKLELIILFFAFFFGENTSSQADRVVSLTKFCVVLRHKSNSLLAAVCLFVFCFQQLVCQKIALK